MPLTKTEPLTCIRDAAKELDVDEETIRDLLRLWKIATDRVPYSPRGRGINGKGMNRLRRLLNLPVKAGA